MPDFPPKDIIEIKEVPEPSTPSADKLKIYAVDQNGFTVLEVKGNTGLTRRLARDNYFVAKVAETNGISKGQAVYISGSQGANEQVKLAQANSINTMPAIGLAIDSGNQNDFIRVMFTGKLAGTGAEPFNTLAFQEGDRLFVSATTPGALTATEPAFPNVKQRIGVVTNAHQNNGEVVVLSTRVKEQEDYNDLSNIPSSFTPASHGNEAHSSTFLTTEVDPTVDGKITTHAGNADAHHTTFTQTDHDALANPHHSNANDPSSGEKAALAGTSGTPSDLNRYVTDGDARNTNARAPTSHNNTAHSETYITQAAITTHEGAADPHTGYQKESEKGQANGYAGLGAGGLVPMSQLASGTPDGTKYIRDDGVLAAPTAAVGNILIQDNPPDEISSVATGKQASVLMGVYRITGTNQLTINGTGKMRIF